MAGRPFARATKRALNRDAVRHALGEGIPSSPQSFSKIKSPDGKPVRVDPCCCCAALALTCCDCVVFPPFRLPTVARVTFRGTAAMCRRWKARWSAQRTPKPRRRVRGWTSTSTKAWPQSWAAKPSTPRRCRRSATVPPLKPLWHARRRCTAPKLVAWTLSLLLFLRHTHTLSHSSFLLFVPFFSSHPSLRCFYVGWFSPPIPHVCHAVSCHYLCFTASGAMSAPFCCAAALLRPIVPHHHPFTTPTQLLMCPPMATHAHTLGRQTSHLARVTRVTTRTASAGRLRPSRCS